MTPCKIDYSQFKISDDGKTLFGLLVTKKSELPQTKAVQNSFLLVRWQMNIVGLQLVWQALESTQNDMPDLEMSGGTELQD